MGINPVITNNFIDSCAFDPKYDPEDSAAKEIYNLYEEGKIGIQIAHSSKKEIEHPNTPNWVKKRAQCLIYTTNVSLIPEEYAQLKKIEGILAGNGKIESIQQDARHIFEAQKYGSYFITTDSRLLNRANKLKEFCTVCVIKPSDFLSIVQQYLKR